MIGLACPFNRAALICKADGTVCREVIASGAFAPSVASGKSASGCPVFLCYGHEKSRPGWKITSTRRGRLRLWQDDRGLWFAADGVGIPPGFAGCSVYLQPIRWRRTGPASFLLTEAYIKHIALMVEPEFPAYSDTLAATLKANANLAPLAVRVS